MTRSDPIREFSFTYHDPDLPALRKWRNLLFGYILRTKLSRNSMARQSLAEYLSEYVARGRDLAYLERRSYRVVRWTYQDVAGRAARMARELVSRGIAAGDRILLWGRNSGEWVAAFFGCI